MTLPSAIRIAVSRAISSSLNSVIRTPQPPTGDAPRNYFLVQRLPDPLVRISRPPVGMVHRERSGPAEDLMVDVECGADGQPRVPRRGRDIDFLERCLIENQAVGHT